MHGAETAVAVEESALRKAQALKTTDINLEFMAKLLGFGLRAPALPEGEFRLLRPYSETLEAIVKFPECRKTHG